MAASKYLMALAVQESWRCMLLLGWTALFVTVKSLLNIKVQRSCCTLTKSAIVKMFGYRHLWPTGNGLAATGDFHFRGLEMTLKRSSNVKVIADSESLGSSSYQCPLVTMGLSLTV